MARLVNSDALFLINKAIVGYSGCCWWVNSQQMDKPRHSV